jgi:hypothetical protein
MTSWQRVSNLIFSRLSQQLYAAGVFVRFALHTVLSAGLRLNK